MNQGANSPQPITIAMADIVQDGVHILQHRSHSPNKAAAGLIGFFGGKVEKDESFEIALARELGEETTATVDQGVLTRIGSFAVTMEHEGEIIHIDGECYRLEMPPGALIEAKEGGIVEMTDAELARRVDELSPATRTVFKKYLMEGN